MPRPLERIVLKALAADPAQRYATAAEFRQALRRYRLRYRRRAAVGSGSLPALVLLVIALWPRPHLPLSGELTVRVWSSTGGGKQGLKVEEPGALPVLAGEWVHLEAHLTGRPMPTCFGSTARGRSRRCIPGAIALSAHAPRPKRRPRRFTARWSGTGAGR